MSDSTPGTIRRLLGAIPASAEPRLTVGGGRPPLPGVLLLPGLLLAGSICLPAQEGEDTFKGREIAEVMSWRGADWLERPSRADEEDTPQLLAQLPIEPGDTVVDMGCGSGYFARRLSPMVGPTGRVLCVDIQPEMLDIARRLADAEGLENIELVLGEPGDPKLEPDSVDLILLVDVYHELARPQAMLEAVRRALVEDGVAALVEYRLEGDSAAWIKLEHRMSVDQVEREWLPAGFTLQRRYDGLPSQHLFLFSPSRDGG